MHLTGKTPDHLVGIGITPYEATVPSGLDTPEVAAPSGAFAVAGDWGALLSEWKLRLRKLDRESWFEPSKARAKELRRCIADAKRTMRGHPNKNDDTKTERGQSPRHLER